MALLDLDKLTLHIGAEPILKDLSLALEPGASLALVGESASGKSMTALSILGLLPADAAASGAVRFDGRDLLGLGEAELRRLRGREIGMVFQEPMTALDPLQTIGDQVGEPARIHHGAGRREAQALARAALDRVGLADIGLERYPHQLSGGQRQRAAIAMAALLGPRLLIADEPTTALDTIAQAEVLALLRRLSREDGAALILITHDLAVAAETVDAVALMHRGEIVETGPIREVLAAPRHPYAQALLAASAPARVRRQSRAPASAEPPVLELRDVSHDYAGRSGAVEGVSLAIRPGEAVGLVGASGAGKSTLLRLALGLARPRSGEVLVDGASLPGARGAELRRLRRRIQAVFQDPNGSFDPRWRIERLVAEPLHLLEDRLGPKEIRRRVEHMLDQVGLSPADADRYPHAFSGGQRQRIAIARALILEPALVALDEAVSALDVTLRAQILKLLAELSDRLGVAYLFVSHDLEVVRGVTDRVAVMQAGRVVEQGATEALFAAPRHPHTAALLAATPSLDRARRQAPAASE